MNFRKIGDGVDGLEAEAEAANGGLVLGALGDVADASDVGLVERLAEVGERQAGRVQGERNLARSAPVAAPTESVLGVLQQFEDEVCAVVVQPSGQLPRLLSAFGAVALPVFLADSLVVGYHRRSLSVRHRFDAKFAQVCTIGKFYDKIWQQTKRSADDIGKPMSDQPDEILTIDEVAAYLKAGKRTVYRLAASGKLPAFKLGGTWRFRRGDLDQWIASRIGRAMADEDEGAV